MDPRASSAPPIRASLARMLIVCCLALGAGGPGVAAAQTGNPFNTLPPLQQDTTSTATTSSTTDQHAGLKRWQEILLFLAGVALIAGIGFAIVGDARRAAPVTEGELSGAHKTSPAGARKAHSKAKARQQGKRAKAARKRNR